MKAAVYSRYGPPDVVQIKDVEKPVPGDDEVLIKVRAASINPADWHLVRGKPYLFRLTIGLGRPKITRIGADVAGVVEAAGGNVTLFKPGDEVFGVCRGALAAYVCTSESKLAMKPDTVSFEQAASVPLAALTAFQGLRDKGHIQPGQKVLINGAAGGVGTFAVQLAKCFGADVTGVCSTRNVEMVRSIGADRVIDYTRQDFTKSEQRYDLIFDLAAGRSLLVCRRVLNPKGTYIGAGLAPGASMIGVVVRWITAATVMSRLASQKFAMYITKWSQADLTAMQELMKAGRVTPVIDRCYTLNEAAEAIRYLEEGHARGKVIIVPDKSLSS
jgi:NADPH:quinone reductase-like Zn-dependent oxidoreductase